MGLPCSLAAQYNMRSVDDQQAHHSAKLSVVMGLQYALMLLHNIDGIGNIHPPLPVNAAMLCLVGTISCLGGVSHSQQQPK